MIIHPLTYSWLSILARAVNMDKLVKTAFTSTTVEYLAMILLCRNWLQNWQYWYNIQNSKGKFFLKLPIVKYALARACPSELVATQVYRPEYSRLASTICSQLVTSNWLGPPRDCTEMCLLSEGSAISTVSICTRHSIDGTGQPFTSQAKATELPVLLVTSSGGVMICGTEGERLQV